MNEIITSVENIIAQKVCLWEVCFTPYLILLCLIEAFLCFYFIKLLKTHKKTCGFSRIVGMDDVKAQIYRDVIFPFYNAKKYKKFHLSLPNGVLFYGPTGCGKTFFIERLSEELAMNYIKISQADLASPYIHETVAKISQLFEEAKRSAPCILFFDEIEGLVPSRDDINGMSGYKHEEINEFLQHLNNAAQDGILVVGATNYLEQIDPAVLRSGRFDVKICIPPPDQAMRKALFESELHAIPHDKKIDFEALALMTDQYTTSDIVNIVKLAAKEAVVRNLKKITQEVLEEIIDNTPSSLSI